MIEKIRELVKKEHEKSDYDYHVSVVVKNALKLANLLGADKEVVEIASLMHDLGRANGIKPSNDNNHHIISAEKARIILKNHPKKEQIIACILSHRGNKDDYPPVKLEEKIVANADAMAHFDTFLDLFRTFVEMENGDFVKALNLIDAKIERDWNKKLTILEAKELVRKEYEAIRLIIDSMKENINKK